MNSSSTNSATERVAVVEIVVKTRSSDVARISTNALAGPLVAEALRRIVLNYAARLVSDLQLPASTNAAIEIVADHEVPKPWPFLMTIGGKPARINLQREQIPLEENILVEVYRNRSLFLTSEVVNAYRRALWGSRKLSPESRNTLVEAMRGCLERNISCERLKTTLLNLDPNKLRDARDLVYATHEEERLEVIVSLPVESYRDLTTDEQMGRVKLRSFQTGIFQRLGLLCPLLQTRSAADLSRDECHFHINDLRLPARRIKPFNGSGILAALQEQLLSEPQLLFNRHSVERNLEFTRESSPVLVQQVLDRVGLNTICFVLEALVSEGFLPLSLARVLDMLTFARGTHPAASKFIIFTPDAETPAWKSVNQAKLEPDGYLRVVRSNLKREIVFRYAQGWKPVSPSMSAYLLDPKIEERIQKSEQEPLTESERVRLLRGFPLEKSDGPLLVLTTEDVRLQLWMLICRELPDVSVLAYQDISLDCNIKSLGHIQFAEEITALSVGAH